MAEPTSMIPGTGVVVTLSASSAQSAAIGTANAEAQPNATTTVRFASDVACWFKIAENPTAAAAAAGNTYLPAGSAECFDIPLGHKVAAIAAGAGYLSLTPMRKG